MYTLNNRMHFTELLYMHSEFLPKWLPNQLDCFCMEIFFFKKKTEKAITPINNHGENSIYVKTFH